MKVLLVEDDLDLREITMYALRRAGFNVVTASDGPHALTQIEAEHPEIVLLDVNLPTVDGFEVCRRIRQGYDIPIIMLTARTGDEDVIRGFHLGADDYVGKPFSPTQLVARIKAIVRRGRTDSLTQPDAEVAVGDLKLDLQSHRATKSGVPIQLTPLEFRILHMLAMNEGRVIPYSRLVEYGWGYEGGDPSLLKTHIYHIRQKLRLTPKESDGIRAIPRIGYSFGRS